jgi:hypothetical protein
VAGIIAKEPDNVGVVVSAMKGVTDDLLGLVERAARREASMRSSRRCASVTSARLPIQPGAGAKLLLAQFEHELINQSILKWALSLRVAAQPRLDLGFRRGRSAPDCCVLQVEFAKVRDVALEKLYSPTHAKCS